jgi:parvulin-like peptidyl-prolyl isomerase
MALVGCGKSGGSVAEINGEKVTCQEFANAVGRSPMGAQALTQLLDNKLMLSMAKEKGVEPTDEQVNQRIEFLKKTQDLESQIKDSGMTMDDVKSQLKIQQAQINLAEQATKDKISDKDVKNAYDSQKQAFDIPERVRVDMLMLPTKQAADKAEKDLKGGATLDKVAKDSGTEVRHFPIPKNSPGIPPELAKAAFDTPKGKISPPISMPSPMGGGEQWLILKPGDTIPAVKVSFDEAKPLILGELATAKAGQDPDYQKKLTEARKKAKVTVSVPSMKHVEKDFASPQPPPGMMGGMR